MPRPPKKPGRKPNGRKPGGRRPEGGSGYGNAKPRRHPPMKRPAATAPQAGSPREGERLQKVLAAAGVASRRECEQLILEGRVQVDGEIVSELGAKVDRARQEIRVDGEPLARPRLQYFAVHKPAGVVSTARDPSGRPRVIDLLPPGVGRMFNVGRLDMASEGLILVTNDGELANRLTHPSHGVEKIYEVQVAGAPATDVLAQVKRGVHLAEGFVHAVDVRVKGRKKGSTLLEMVLDEGRNREIRRLLARLGHKVQRLVRVAVGPVRLGEMPRGAVRPLTQEEIRKLRAAAEGRPEADRRETSGRPPRAPGSLGHGRKPRRPIGGDGPPRKRKPPAAGAEAHTRRVIGDDSGAPPKRPRPAKGKGGPPKRPGGAGRRPGGPGKRSGGPRKGSGGGPKRSGRP
ncbi:MAG TPA: pseudouridine synthase [Lacipirellula sp.]